MDTVIDSILRENALFNVCVLKNGKTLGSAYIKVFMRRFQDGLVVVFPFKNEVVCKLRIESMGSSGIADESILLKDVTQLIEILNELVSLVLMRFAFQTLQKFIHPFCNHINRIHVEALRRSLVVQRRCVDDKAEVPL